MPSRIGRGPGFWISSAFIAGSLMIADGLAMIGVTRAFHPRPAPGWATGPFFWPLAWSVWLFQLLLGPAGHSAAGGPSFMAVALGALVDLLLFTFAVAFVRRRRRRPA